MDVDSTPPTSQYHMVAVSADENASTPLGTRTRHSIRQFEGDLKVKASSDSQYSWEVYKEVKVDASDNQNDMLL